MDNKENFAKLSGNNDFEVSEVAGGIVFNSLNVNRKRPAALQCSDNDNLTAKQPKLESPTNFQLALGYNLPKPDQPNNESLSPRNQLSNKENFKVPTDIVQLYKFFKDPEQMKQFDFEQKVEDWYGLFDIYTVDNDVSYAAFHCHATIRQMSDRNDSKLFFYYSEELLRQFQSFAVPFQGIEHILMVLVNHKTDRVTPLGIDQWLNGDGSPTTTVTKCNTPYDLEIQESILKIWPTAKVIGCSDEYQKEVKLFAKRNKGLSDLNKELTRLACTLCYVPQMYISTGIEVIEKHSSSEYGACLVRYLRTNWIGIQSIFGEDIIHRSVKVCKQFNKRMEDDYFNDNRFRAAVKPVNHIIDFIGVLRTFSKVKVVEMSLDGSTLERHRNRRFELNTKLQKQVEANILSSFNELNQSIEVSKNDEEAIKQAIEKFMFSILSDK